MSITMMLMDAIHEDPANLRAHPESNINAIRASLKEFGQQKPIVVDQGGKIVAGNGTFKAAVALGWKRIAAVKTKLEGIKSVAYAIADNRIAELATWETELAGVLDELRKDDSIDIGSIGFDDADIDALLGDLATEQDHGGSSSDRDIADLPKDERSDLVMAPFPYFGNKRKVIPLVWKRFGRPKQYIEPFCGSAAMLLGSYHVAKLEVINDLSGFIANFWRSVKHQPEKVAEFADYPVSHLDFRMRENALVAKVKELAGGLADPDWPGDAKVAGWWCLGQCSDIGLSYCSTDSASHQLATTVQGLDCSGSKPHIKGQRLTSNTAISDPRSLFDTLGTRIKRVKVLHGTWDRSMWFNDAPNDVAVFFDPPYRSYDDVYRDEVTVVLDDIVSWCKEHSDCRIALCGHDGDYDLSGWDVVQWDKGGATVSGSTKNKSNEAIWFSPGCLDG